MTNLDELLDKLKKEALLRNEAAKKNGGNIKEFNCPDCGKTLETDVPSNDEDRWQDLVACYECGNYHIHTKTINGVVVSHLQ